MKRYHLLSAGALAGALALVAGAAFAQAADSAKTTVTTTTTTLAQETVVKTTPVSPDSAIIATLIAANTKEAAAAETAIAQAQSERVKEFARRIQRDHAKFTEDLQEFLAKTSGGMASGVVQDSMKPVPDSIAPVPDSKAPVPDSVAKENVPPADTTYANQETKNQPVTEPTNEPAPFAGKTGKEFDQAWVGAMVSEHEAAVRNLRENIIPQIQNSDLKAIVQGFLPVMGTHLRDAQQLQAQLK